MKFCCLSILCLAALAVGGFTARPATAADGCGGGAGFGMGYGYGYFPGFGVPDCISVRTPPYFAIHPPVYYSTRYARPYGISPFAAPPQVHVPESYRARLEAQFVRAPSVNPYCCGSKVAPGEAVPAEEVPAEEVPAEEVPAEEVPAEEDVVGPVRANPFVPAAAKLAARD